LSLNACWSICFSQVPRATPHPSFNEPLHLKIPHPAAVLEIDVLEEDVTGEIATVRPPPSLSREDVTGEIATVRPPPSLSRERGVRAWAARRE